MSKTFNVYCFDVTICSHSQLLIIWGKRAREQEALFKCIHNPHFSKELQLLREIIYQGIIKRRSSFSFSFSCLPCGQDANEQWDGRKRENPEKSAKWSTNSWIKSWLNCIISPKFLKLDSIYVCIYIYAASIQLGTFAVFFSRYCDWVTIVL